MTKLSKQELIKHLESITLEAMKEDVFSTPRFGEEKDYLELSQQIADTLKKSCLPDDSLFEANETGSTINLIYQGKKFPLLSIFRDTFSSLANCSCREYCSGHFWRFHAALEVCEALLTTGEV